MDNTLIELQNLLHGHDYAMQSVKSVIIGMFKHKPKNKPI